MLGFCTLMKPLPWPGVKGYVKGMYKEEILLFCNIFAQKSLVFLLQKIFLAFIKAYYMALEC